MSNATHRHSEAVKTPRIPWGHMLAVVVLIAALFAGLMLAASLTSPANASTLAGPHESRAVTVYTRFLTLHAGASMGINPAAHYLQSDNG